MIMIRLSIVNICKTEIMKKNISKGAKGLRGHKFINKYKKIMMVFFTFAFAFAFDLVASQTLQFNNAIYPINIWKSSGPSVLFNISTNQLTILFLAPDSIEYPIKQT
jgi:hypothetical protein